jgi:hypothetical protein
VILELRLNSSYSACWAQHFHGMFSLVFDLQWAPSSGKNWGVITSLWTPHQTWWTSVPDRANNGLAIIDRTSLSGPSWSTTFFDRIVAFSSCSASFFTDVTGLVRDVFNMKRSPYDFNFYLVHVGISSVGNWTFFNLIKFIHILFWLVVTSIL